MTYSLKFHSGALDEWNEIPESVKEYFKKNYNSVWKIQIFQNLVFLVDIIYIK